ncbi:7634_t:CDS:1 [Cetraspora pellucida]|uniref:7634_t:CDS:1 n=1 Tax=Cetraspora pellucida TaxID=1433469 RepID=A0ACA9K7M6_9GLOM|nr:7634_t:CDS:1 [Cetraspora pellucida]
MNRPISNKESIIKYEQGPTNEQKHTSKQEPIIPFINKQEPTTKLSTNEQEPTTKLPTSEQEPISKTSANKQVYFSKLSANKQESTNEFEYVVENDLFDDKFNNEKM